MVLSLKRTSLLATFAVLIGVALAKVSGLLPLLGKDD
jgi:hypothetical protein